MKDKMCKRCTWGFDSKEVPKDQILCPYCQRKENSERNAKNFIKSVRKKKNGK